jgi:hypothetical protein
MCFFSQQVGLSASHHACGQLSLLSRICVCDAGCAAAGLKARKRAQFAAAVRCITDLDDDGLRLVLGYIPAWVKFSEYERARFLNDSLQLLWPAFDRAICNLLKAELEPLLQVPCNVMTQLS